MLPAKNEKWFVFYCKSRTEKKTFEELINDGYNAYLPLVDSDRVWSDRIKKLKLPLIPGYIFVKCNLHKISSVNMHRHIVAPVKIGETIATLRQKDIDLLKKIENNIISATIEQRNIHLGDEVSIICGPLKNYSGICMEEAGKKYFILHLGGINCAIKVKIDKESIIKLKKNK